MLRPRSNHWLSGTRIQAVKSSKIITDKSPPLKCLPEGLAELCVSMAHALTLLIFRNRGRDPGISDIKEEDIPGR